MRRIALTLGIQAAGFALLGLIAGCQFLIIGVGAEPCDNTEPRCEGNNLVICEGGFSVPIQCANTCNPTTLTCSECGDGVTDPGEACDDGNTLPGDGCAANCLGFEICGDGQIDIAKGEICDDGNTQSGDGCRADCLKIEVCGDGTQDAGEVCDDGNNTPGDGCRADCQGLENCGDGVLDVNEECDDGNTQSGDGCNAGCQEEVCGNGVVDVGEQCDDGNLSGGDGCDANCSTESLGCGNGIIEQGEVCDDGNNISGDGCRGDCQKVEVCGDGIQDAAAGEQCDDANQENGDACKNDCTNNVCGDGVLFVGVEECDDGNTNNGDGCTNSCIQTFCGDGILEAGEECDDGNATPGDGCEVDCTFTCGSGIAADARVLDPESGHCYLQFDSPLPWQNAQDHCVSLGGHLATISNAAENTLVRLTDPNPVLWIGLNDRGTEDAFVWVTGERTTFLNFSRNEPNNAGGNQDCGAFFGNGNFTWDDDNCDLPRAYVCEIETPVCGNGFIEAGEECDDGNTNNGDGCSSTCSFICGQGVSGADNIVEDPITGGCYVGFTNEDRNWASARDFCISRGGHLVTIHTNRENGFARSAAGSNTWIGLNDIATENNFVWITGESFGFSNFENGQPNNDEGGQDCIHFLNNTSRWNDETCTGNNFNFICEF